MILKITFIGRASILEAEGTSIKEKLLEGSIKLPCETEVELCSASQA